MLIALLKPTEVTYLDMGRAEKKALRVDDQLVSLSCNGKPHIVQWKVGLYRSLQPTSPRASSERFTMLLDDTISHLHQQYALHRLINAVDCQLTLLNGLFESSNYFPSVITTPL